MTTPIEPSRPVDTDPNQTQLDLFPTTADPARDPAIAPAIARASVSPSWWPYIARLYGRFDSDIVVHVCCESDGVLLLEASAAGDSATLEQHILQPIRNAVANVCGCCGGWPAKLLRLRLAEPTRRVCGQCEARLRAGEAYLAVADDYWRVDGTRRLEPRARSTARTTAESPTDKRTEGTRRECTTLPPDELRRVYQEIRDTMHAECVGHDLSRLALLAALHIGGGLSRGGRALILGPSGVGKTTAILAMRRALENWNVPFIITSAIDLTSPGWAGTTVAGVIESALGDGEPADSVRSRHAVVCIDEVNHITLMPHLTGNMAAKKNEVLSSLLSLSGFGTPLHLGDGTRTWSSDNALVIGMGAFEGTLDLSKTVGARELKAAGLPIEVASRFAEQIVVLKPLSERALIDLLRRWPALTSLSDVCTRLGYTARISDEAVARAARAVTLGHDGSTPRTAGGWLVSALRDALIGALADPERRDIVITPDSLSIPPTATRPRPPHDPPEDSGDWDATIVLRPR